MNELTLLPSGKFEFTSTGLLIADDTTYEEWEQVGINLQRIEGCIQFWIGDWINWGELHFEEEYAQAIEETGYTYNTLRQYGYVAKRIAFDDRSSNLGFTHHLFVAPLTPDEQRHYLKASEQGNWTKAELRKNIREDKKKSPVVALAADTPENEILHGDMQLLWDSLPNDSVDLFFTDPPYHADKTDTYLNLAELAAAKLRPGGLCLAYSGQMHLPQVVTAMSEHLTYWWLFALRHTGGHLTIWNRYLWNDWKPILVFAKPYADGSLPLAPDWVQDFIDGGGRDKQYHDWGQDVSEATYWIEKLTTPDMLICDPYTGGGTIPAACKLTKRRWIATDIEIDHVMTARARLEKIS